MYARVALWMANAARTQAPKVAQLFNRLKKNGYKGATTSEGVVAWMKANPLNVTMLATSAAAVGLEIASWFDSADEAEATLKGGGADVVDTEAREMIAAEGAKTSGFIDNKDDALTEAEEAAISFALRWAVDHYGSVEAARKAHSMQEAFLNTDARFIDRGFRRGWHQRVITS